MASLEQALEKAGYQMIFNYTSGYKENMSDFFIIACNKKNPKEPHPDNVYKVEVGGRAMFSLLVADPPGNRKSPTSLNRLAFQLHKKENYAIKAFAFRKDEHGDPFYELITTL